MDVSFRFCTGCLLKFCSHLSYSNTNQAVRFFVPTIDYLMREHFIYLEIEQPILTKLLQREDPISIDLKNIAKILHVQKGEWPSTQDREAIEHIYQHITPQNDLTRLAS